MNDAQLMRLAAGLDPSALEVLYERHHLLAFSLAAQIVGSRDRAQQVVQKAFLNLWREAGRYDPARGLVRTWLMSMVHDRGIDAVRRLPVDKRMQTDATARATPPCQTDPARGQVSPQDDAQTIRVALQALPESGRPIIELAYFAAGRWTKSQRCSSCR